MLLHFDKFGTLKEQLSYETGEPQVGDTCFVIYAYFDISDISASYFSDALIRFLRPDLQKSEYPNLYMTFTSLTFDKTKVQGNVTSTFFENGETYPVFKFDFNDFIAQDENEDSIILLDTPGKWKSSITLIGTNRERNVTGRFTFEVLDSVSEYDENAVELDVSVILSDIQSQIARKLNKNDEVYVRQCSNFETKAEAGTLDASTFVADTIVLDVEAKKIYVINHVTANTTETVYADDYEEVIDLNDFYTKDEIAALLATKQDTLVSGVNIKTLNNESLLGSGNIEITASGVWGNITGDINDQTDLQGELNNKQDVLVSGVNIKTVNGSDILGSGNVSITTYQAFKSSWPTTGTTKAFCDEINGDSSATIGMAYLGGASFSDLPFNGNGDVVVEIMEGPNHTKAIHLILTSSNVAPYHWEYTYWNNGSESGWKGFQPELVSGTNIKTINNTSLLGSGNVQVASTADVQAIEDLIPEQASSENQLADKAFVNSSIATNTAYFLGTYNIVDDLGLTTSATHTEVAAAIATKLASLSIEVSNNDYVFVSYPDATDPTQFTQFDRYKYNSEDVEWIYEYTLNNSSFTAAQWAAINSGITSSMISNFVTLDGAQTITGAKTFNSVIKQENGIQFNTNKQIDIKNSSGSLYWRIGETEILPFGTSNLGSTQRKFSNLYLSGSLKDGNNVNYGLTLPNTTGWSANKEIGLAEGTCNYFASLTSPLDSTQIEIITNGKPTIIDSFSTYRKIIIMPPQTAGAGEYVGYAFTTTSTNSWTTQIRGYRIRANGSFAISSNSIKLSDTAELTIDNLVKLNANASGYGFTLPSTSGFTADKTLATTDQIPSPELFECTYGTTTYAQITTAVSNGKIPYVKNGGRNYFYTSTAGDRHYFFIISATTTYGVYVNTSDTWVDIVYPLQTISNKTTTLSSSSTDTQYPSAKVVYDNVKDIREQLKGKNKGYVLSYAMTIAKIKTGGDYPAVHFYVYTNGEWVDKLTELNNGDYDSITIGNASFNSTNDNITLSDVSISDETYLLCGVYETSGTPPTSINFSSYYLVPIDILELGDDIYITELNVPDRWVSNNLADIPATRTFNMLETKVDLSNYYTKTQVDERTFNIVKVSEMSSTNYFSQAQVALISNGNPTKIEGTIQTYNNIFITSAIDEGTQLRCNFTYTNSGQSGISYFIITKSNGYCNFRSNRVYFTTNELYLQTDNGGNNTIYFNGKRLPNYPSSPATNQVLTYTTGNLLSWSDFPSPELFFCTHGTTTFAQITTALSAGKLPICLYNDNRYYIYSSSSSTVHRFSSMQSDYVRYITVDDSDNWSAVQAYNLQLVSNKVTSISSSSTDTQYPSAKCVYDNLVNVREVAEGKCFSCVISYAETAPTEATFVANKYKRFDGTNIATWADYTTYINGYVYSNDDFNSQSDDLVLTRQYIITDTYTVVRPDLDLKLGDIIIVKEIDVPDRWWDAGNDEANILETTKVDLSNYYTKTQVDERAFNVINASDISNNELIQAQYDLITNGNPTLIKGTFLSSGLLTYLDGFVIIDGNGNAVSNGWRYDSYGNRYSATYYINGTTKVISILSGNNKLFINNLQQVNGKNIPAYPSSPATNQVLTYTTGNALSWATPQLTIPTITFSLGQVISQVPLTILLTAEQTTVWHNNRFINFDASDLGLGSGLALADDNNDGFVLYDYFGGGVNTYLSFNGWYDISETQMYITITLGKISSVQTDQTYATQGTTLIADGSGSTSWGNVSGVSYTAYVSGTPTVQSNPLKFVKLTQTEYDNLSSVDADTFYIIVGA